jgi:hypothetical protein
VRIVDTDETSQTARLEVPGGWLYRTLTASNPRHIAMAFVPAPAEAHDAIETRILADIVAAIRKRAQAHADNDSRVSRTTARESECDEIADWLEREWKRRREP